MAWMLPSRLTGPPLQMLRRGGGSREWDDGNQCDSFWDRCQRECAFDVHGHLLSFSPEVIQYAGGSIDNMHYAGQ